MKLRCFPYRIPFKRPLITSGRTYKYRTGLIFSAEDLGTIFYGEAAPLPGFSSENMADISKQSERCLGEWERILSNDSPFQLLKRHYREKQISPSIRFGLDTLAYQLEAHRNGIHFLSDLINYNANRVKVNGLVNLSSKSKTMEEIKQLTDRGFGTIKCKVGIETELEFRLLKSIRKQYPNLRIRLDANRVWLLEEAKQRLNRLANLNIEYCEEPLRHPTPEAFRQLKPDTAVPLAIDETMTSNERWQEYLPHCSVLVLKPMVIGSFDTLINIHRLANAHNCDTVITTSLESSIGRSVTALLAARLGTPERAHGLNTGYLLADDVTPGWPAITRGSIGLSALDQQKVQPEKLQQIATAIIDSE